MHPDSALICVQHLHSFLSSHRVWTFLFEIRILAEQTWLQICFLRFTWTARFRFFKISTLRRLELKTSLGVMLVAFIGLSDRH